MADPTLIPDNRLRIKNDPQKWEYTTTLESDLFFGDQDKMGEQGWILCTVHEGDVYWRRPLPEMAGG